jgi:hypothetical protein
MRLGLRGWSVIALAFISTASCAAAVEPNPDDAEYTDPGDEVGVASRGDTDQRHPPGAPKSGALPELPGSPSPAPPPGPPVDPNPSEAETLTKCAGETHQ